VAVALLELPARLEVMGQVENLGVVTVEAEAKLLYRLFLLLLEEQEECQAAEVVAEERLPAEVKPLLWVEQEPEERCVYGPGNSEYSRVIWPGCAKA